MTDPYWYCPCRATSYIPGSVSDRTRCPECGKFPRAKTMSNEHNTTIGQLQDQIEDIENRLEAVLDLNADENRSLSGRLSEVETKIQALEERLDDVEGSTPDPAWTAGEIDALEKRIETLEEAWRSAESRESIVEGVDETEGCECIVCEESDETGIRDAVETVTTAEMREKFGLGKSDDETAHNDAQTEYDCSLTFDHTAERIRLGVVRNDGELVFEETWELSEADTDMVPGGVTETFEFTIPADE